MRARSRAIASSPCADREPAEHAQLRIEHEPVRPVARAVGRTVERADLAAVIEEEADSGDGLGDALLRGILRIDADPEEAGGPVVEQGAVPGRPERALRRPARASAEPKNSITTWRPATVSNW